MMNWGNYGWGMGFGWIFMIIFWALVILGTASFFRTASRREKEQEQKGTPLDVLKMRYANGKLAKEEFERMKDDIIK